MKTETKYTDLALLLLMGLVPLLWFRDGYNALAGFDFAVYLNPVETLRKSYYLWSDTMAGGYDISHEISSVPYYLLFSLPVMLGASLYTAEKIVFVAIFTLQGLSMYYMLGALFEERASKRAIALVGAVIYTFSYPVMAHFGRGNMMALLAYGLLPLVLGLLYRGFTKPRKQWKYITLVVLLSFPIAATKGHPADFVVLMGVVSYFVLFNALTSVKKAHVIIFSAKTLVCVLFVSLWWIVPNIIYLRDFGLSNNDLVKEGFFNLDILSYYSRGTSILNVFRNERLDLWFDLPQDPVFNTGLYRNDVFVMIGLMLPVVAFISLCVAKREKMIFFFSSLSVIAVFMGKGSHEPLGWAFEWLYLHVPGFFFFRAPYRIFSSLITFALTPLIAFAVGSLAWRVVNESPEKGLCSFKKVFESPITFKSLKKVTVSLAVITLLLSSAAYVWPVFTGAHLREKGTLREPGVFHNIPDGYSYADEWLKAQKRDFKVYYPYEVYDANTTWGYNGPDPSFELLNIPKVASRPGGTVYLRYQKPIESLNKVLWEFKYGDIKKILSFYNVRYALLHQDFNRWVMPSYNFNVYADSLFRISGMELKNKVGPLAFYGNDEYLPKIYGAQKAYLLAGDEEAFPALSLTGYLDSPFLVMVKDIDVSKIQKNLDDLEGIVFYNSNTVDLVCALLAKGYARETSGGSLNILAGEKGVYEFYLKDPAGKVSLDGHKSNEAERGFSWRKIGEKELDKKQQTLKIWNADSPQRVLVMERGLFKKIKKLVERRLEDSDFEVAYLFNGALRGSGSVSLSGSNNYLLSVSVPVQYSKKKAFNSRMSVWRYESGAAGTFSSATWKDIGQGESKKRVGLWTGDFDSVDLGEYPKLVFEGERSSERLIKVKTVLELDGRGGPENTFEFERTISVNGEVDLGKIVKERYSAGIYTLKHIEIKLEESKITRSDRLYAATGPQLTGEFGITETPCRGPGGMFLLGDASFEIKGGKCGGPATNMVVKPGEYTVRNRPVGVFDYLVLIRKAGDAAHAKSATPVAFEKINTTRYVMRPALEKMRIVFSDSYNGGWSVYVNGKKHSPLKVNGYANGFIIPRPDGEITLEYEPQRAFDYSKAASLAAAAVVVATGVTKARKTSKEETGR